MNAQKTKAKNHRLQAFFLRGLIALLPIVFTVTILIAAYGFVTQYVTGPVNGVIYWSLEHNAAGWRALDAMGVNPLDHEFISKELPRGLEDHLRARGLTPESREYSATLAEYRSNNMSFLRDLPALAIDADDLHDRVAQRVPAVVGLVVSLLLVLTLGSLAGGFVGRSVLRRTERAMHLIPVVRSIYPYTKQLVDFFLAEKHHEFDTVVAVPYPNKGLISIGFVTSAGLKSLRERTGKNLVSVFVPSSPMPMTGYTIFIPAEELTPLPFSVDEALRTLVSGGVLIPVHEETGVSGAEAMAQVRTVPVAGDSKQASAHEQEEASS